MVNDHLYRGAQPTDEGFGNLAKMGVKTDPGPARVGQPLARREEGRRSRRNEVRKHPDAWDATPPAASVAKALALFNDKEAGPVFVHCRRGADRTGTIIACYRISHDGWDNAKALSEAKVVRHGMDTSGMQHYIRDYTRARPERLGRRSPPARTNILSGQALACPLSVLRRPTSAGCTALSIPPKSRTSIEFRVRYLLYCVVARLIRPDVVAGPGTILRRILVDALDLSTGAPAVYAALRRCRGSFSRSSPSLRCASLRWRRKEAAAKPI